MLYKPFFRWNKNNQLIDIYNQYNTRTEYVTRDNDNEEKINSDTNTDNTSTDNTSTDTNTTNTDKNITITNPINNHTDNISYSWDWLTKSQENFANGMYSLYEKELKKRGLNPEFALYLTMQDALESSWGKSDLSSKYFNYGGIKARNNNSINLPTLEYNTDQLEKTNQSFQIYKSPEEYIKDKIDLLNNKRYNVFQYNPSEYVNRVVSGGYATDPTYKDKLNSMYYSIIKRLKDDRENWFNQMLTQNTKKLQEGGIIEAKNWLKEWYRNRRPQIKQNLEDAQTILWPIGNSEYNRLIGNIDSTNIKVNPELLEENVNGAYLPLFRTIILKDDNVSTAVHEFTHSSRPESQIKKIDYLKDFYGNYMYDSQATSRDNYLDSSSELYSRLMALRQYYNFDPNHKFTSEEIDNLKNKLLKEYVIIDQNPKDKKSLFITVFDKNRNIIEKTPKNHNHIINPETVEILKIYNVDNSFNILNRYSSDFITRLLNEVASNKSNIDLTKLGKYGLKILKSK